MNRQEIIRIGKLLGANNRRRMNQTTPKAAVEIFEERRLLSGVMAGGAIAATSAQPDDSIGRVFFELKDADGSGDLSI